MAFRRRSRGRRRGRGKRRRLHSARPVRIGYRF